MIQEKYFFPHQIVESYLDAYGHMNHSVYLTVFEMARWDMIRKNGQGPQIVKQTNVGPVILEINLRFRRELRLGQKITIETQIASRLKKIAIFNQEIKDEENQSCCNAEFKFGLFDLTARKLVTPPDVWLKALGL